MSFKLLSFLALTATASCKIYFKEDFNSASWKEKWVESVDWKPKEQMGEWKQVLGEFHGPDEKDLGIQTGPDARHFGLSTKLATPINNEDSELVLQYTLKHEQDLDCGGAYIKLTPPATQNDFGGETPYYIMFGPDMCGPSNKKIHVIFNYPAKDEYLQIKKKIDYNPDKLTHLYTLAVYKDNTFEVFVDKESVRKGKLADEFDFLHPKEIKDPAVTKPVDWVDTKKILDPNDKKPEGYDDIPKEIPDPTAEKPEDWDDEEDGEWEAPKIDNPDWYPWKQKKIPNPDYKGEWVHPMIPNPDYFEDPKLFHRCPECAMVGFELWQVKAGSIFDDIIITDNLKEAFDYATETFGKKQAPEKEAFDKAEEEKMEKARAESAAAGGGDEGDEDEDDEEDHDEL